MSIEKNVWSEFSIAIKQQSVRAEILNLNSVTVKWSTQTVIKLTRFKNEVVITIEEDSDVNIINKYDFCDFENFDQSEYQICSECVLITASAEGLNKLKHVKIVESTTYKRPVNHS